MSSNPAHRGLRSRAFQYIALASALSSCAFHSTATRWNGLKGEDGRPVYYAVTTKVGLRLFVALPFLGHLGIEGQVDSMTDDLAERGGDRVRIVQGSTENYWYGFPPLTWVLTPVVTTLNAEYTPSEAEIRKTVAEELRREHRGEALSEAALEELVDARVAALLSPPAQD